MSPRQQSSYRHGGETSAEHGDIRYNTRPRPVEALVARETTT